MKNLIKLTLTASALVLLASCGGGGGGGGSGAVEQITPPTLDLQTAWLNYFQQDSVRSFTVSGDVNGTNVGGDGEMIISFVSPINVQIIDPTRPFSGPITNFDNAARTAITSNTNLIVNNTTTIISSTRDFFATSDGQIRMIFDRDEDEQTVITEYTSFPSQVTNGSAGTLFSGTVFSQLGYNCGTENATYSVATESNTALIVTVTFTQNTTNRQIGQCTTQRSTQQNKYRLKATELRPLTSIGSLSTATGSITLTF